MWKSGSENARAEGYDESGSQPWSCAHAAFILSVRTFCPTQTRRSALSASCSLFIPLPSEHPSSELHPKPAICDSERYASRKHSRCDFSMVGTYTVSLSQTQPLIGQVL